MSQTFTRRSRSALALVASIAIASLTLSAAAFGQTTTEPLNQYTSTTPTVPPTSTVAPTQTTNTQPVTPTPTPTTAPEPTATTGAPAPKATPAAAPNTPPERLALTGYDPLIVGFAGVLLMLGAVALQRRRGTR